MRKRRFSEEQIIGVLREQQMGLPAAELCRKHSISDATVLHVAVALRRYGGLAKGGSATRKPPHRSRHRRDLISDPARCWCVSLLEQLHTITAMAGGFAWPGETETSLSEVARAITGTR